MKYHQSKNSSLGLGYKIILAFPIYIHLGIQCNSYTMSNKKPDIISSDDNEIIESFYVKEFDWNVIIYTLSFPNY